VGEAVEEFKTGAPVQTTPDIRVEIPVDAHLPHAYVPGERLRLEAYRRIAEATDQAAIEAVREELADRYGPLPTPVENLLAVAAFRAHARRAGLTEVTLAGSSVRFAPVELAESAAMRVHRLYPRTVIKPAVRTMLVPRPTTARVGGQPLRDLELLGWCRGVVDAILGSA
jgi:transcription-repair coupling factor (superfamily II helicase)